MSQRRRSRDDIEFNFFSFPPLMTFFVGMFVAVLLYEFIAFPLFILALLGTSWGMAHVLTHAWRRKKQEKRRQRADEDERERRALAARANASLANEEASPSAARRRRRRRGRPTA